MTAAALVAAALPLGSATAWAGSGCTPDNAVIPLTEGVSVSASTVSSSSFCEFSFVPDEGLGAARFAATIGDDSTGSSAYRLYVRVGALPTTGVYDCFMQSAFQATSVPPCLVEVPSGAIAYARVQRSLGGGSFQITATSDTVAPNCPPETVVLEDDVPLQLSRSAGSGQGCQFEFAADAAADFTRVQIAPDGGNYSMFVKQGDVPTTSSFDCSAQTCDFLADDQTVHVLVPYASSGQFTITASTIVVPTLLTGVPASGVLNAGEVTLYKVVAPPGSRHVSVTMTGPEQHGWACYTASGSCPYQRFPDVDMYIYHQRLPTGGPGAACQPRTPGAPEQCVFDDLLFEGMCTHYFTGCGRPLGPGNGPSSQGPLSYHPYQGDGKYFVLLHGYRGPADYNVVATQL